MITPLIEQMGNWITANRTLIGQNVSQAVSEIVGWVRELVRWLNDGGWVKIKATIKELVLDFRSIAGDIQSTVGALGGWKNAIEDAFGAAALAKMGMFIGKMLLLRKLLKYERPASKVAAGAGGDAAAGAGAGVATFAARVFPWMRLGVGVGLATYSPTIGQGEQRNLNMLRQSLSSRQQYALFRLQQMGLSPIEASGLVANFTAESGLNPSVTGDKGTAYGIGQWHPDRQAQFAKLFGIPMTKSTVDQQLAFARWELGNTEKGAQARAAQATTAAEAGSDYSRYYERPANADQEAQTRGILAQQIDARNQMMFRHAPEVAAAPKAQVEVSFKNVPPGARVEARDEQGNAVPARVAYNMVGRQW